MTGTDASLVCGSGLSTISFDGGRFPVLTPLRWAIDATLRWLDIVITKTLLKNRELKTG
jgi:hypothetical protein